MALAAILSRIWIYKLMGPLNKLTAAIQETKGGVLGVTVPNPSNNELGILTGQFNEMSMSVKELFIRNEAAQEEKRSLEIETLKWQINPHFINNTLNVIRWMAIMNEEANIAESITSLSDLIDPIFRSQNRMCKLSEEAEYIRNYIKIMNFRYAGGLSCKFDIPQELTNCRILRFTLQPIVENSILHGLHNKAAGIISISAWDENGNLWIQARDNGTGMPDSRLAKVQRALTDNSATKEGGKARVGLPNINRRIKLQFGDSYGVEIQSQLYNGTTVLIKIPLLP